MDKGGAKAEGGTPAPRGVRCPRDPIFSRFGTTPACDRQTDRQARTDGHTTTSYTALA